MNVLIAGHGYVGAALAEHLNASGVNVIALTRSPASAASTAVSKPYPIHACDISDPAAVVALRETLPGLHAIVHCASSTRGGGGDAYRAVYLNGARHLLETFPGTPLLFTSSTGVYAQADGSTVTEDSPTNPARETGRILLDTESLVLSTGGAVARLAGIFGPGRSYLLKQFLTGQAVIEEDGSRLLNQVHRADIVNALARLLDASEAAGEIYNVSDDAPLTQLECYTFLSEHFGEALPPIGPRNLERKREWTNKRVSNAKLRALGWAPIYPSFKAAVLQDPTIATSTEGQL